MESAANCRSAAPGRGGVARRTGAVRGGGSDRGTALRGGEGTRHGLAADRAAVRCARTPAALADRIAQPGCGRGDGGRPANGAGADRRIGGEGRTWWLSSAAGYACGFFAEARDVSGCGSEL